MISMHWNPTSSSIHTTWSGTITPTKTRRLQVFLFPYLKTPLDPLGSVYIKQALSYFLGYFRPRSRRRYPYISPHPPSTPNKSGNLSSQSQFAMFIKIFLISKHGILTQNCWRDFFFSPFLCLGNNFDWILKKRETRASSSASSDLNVDL